MALEEPGHSASEAASAASTGVAALPFKPESADVGFPWAGATLLLLLIVVAVMVKWRGASARPTWLSRLAPASGAPSQGELSVEATTRLNPQVQLHVVRWSGRRILLATAPNMPPVVLDRQDGEPVDKEQP
jgi:hypothetical protein